MRLPVVLALSAAVGVTSLSPALAAVDPGTGTSYDVARVVVPMTFPVAGPTSFSDTFLTCRSGCTRKHMGQDLMGPKMTPLVAAFDGVVTSVHRETSAGGGNYLTISADRGAAAGWSAMYVHVNNDTPGTDDARGSAAWSFPGGIEPGARVLAGQLVAWRGDSGNAESTGPHLHFELRKGGSWGGVVYNAYPSLVAARRLVAPVASGPHPDGSLVRHPNGSLFLLDDGRKLPVTPAALAAARLSAADAVSISAAESLGYPTGAPLPAADAPHLVRAEGEAAVLAVDPDGALHPVSREVMASRRWRNADVTVVDALPEGEVREPMPLRDGTLVQTPSHRVGVVSGGRFRRLLDARMVAAYGYGGLPRLLVPDALAAALPSAPLSAP